MSAKPNINELMLMFTNGGMLANKKNYISWKMGYAVTMRIAKKLTKIKLSIIIFFCFD